MRIVLSILISLLISCGGYSQIIIDQNDMPKEGDTLRMSLTNILPSDYMKTGQDMTWNFSSLNKMVQQVDTFVSVLNVPPVYWFTFPPVLVSNLASPGTLPIPIPGIAVNDFFNFYNNSPASFAYLGFAFQFSGLPIMMKYDSPDILCSFPCTMGTTWDSQSSSSASFPGLGYYSTVRNRTSIADGWGTLITPFGNFQTIRVKSQWVEYDSIYIDTLGMGFPLARNVTEYKWFAKNQGEPLLEITEEGMSRTAVYRDIINHTGISQLKKEIINVFPNPSEGAFIIRIRNMNHPARLTLFRPDGTVASEEPVQFTGGLSNVITYNDLAPGIYFLKVSDEKRIFEGKMIVR